MTKNQAFSYLFVAMLNIESLRDISYVLLTFSASKELNY